MTRPLGATEAIILDTLERTGKFVHTSGIVRRSRYGKAYDYGRREANAIAALEQRGLVAVKRDFLKSMTSGEQQIVYVVRRKHLLGESA